MDPKLPYPPVLAVDLDGTLCRSDTLWETLWVRLRLDAGGLAPLALALLQGRKEFKLALQPEKWLNPELLPWNDAVLDYVREAKRHGSRVILASASPQAWVERVASHFGLFHEAWGTTTDRDLKSSTKAQWLAERAAEGFSYIGNARADWPVWRKSTQILNANPDPGFRKKVAIDFPKVQHLGAAIHPGQAWWKLLRPHQWSKNFLLIVPLLTAHTWHDPAAVLRVIGATGAFCLLASTIYICNDLFDLQNDRSSLTKKARPLAAGTVALPEALLAVPILLTLGLGWSALLQAKLFFVAVSYVGAALLYATFLRRTLILDVVVLAGLYTLRIYAGAAAAAVPVSLWLFGFSIFVFLSLALAKRCAELQKRPHGPLPGRAYDKRDEPILHNLGIGSAFASMVILALYVSSSDVVRLYLHPQRLWGLSLLHSYWMMRFWILIGRGQVADDPVGWALRDRAAYGVVLGAAWLMGWAGPQ